jgi:hypothetical protein
MLASALLLLLLQPPVSACAVSDEPAFGLDKDHPVQVGGGAMYAASRERRYLDALRGPGGEALQYRRTGSLPIEVDRLFFLDRYEVTYAGLEKPIYLFLDAYHFDDALKAPKGFTCAVPIALSPPGPDPFLAADNALALAVEQGGTAEFPPISLDADGSAQRGIIFDRFRLTARAAKAAVAAGKPIDLKQSQRELIGLGTIVVAYPLRCGDDKDPVPPASLELVTSQGQAPARTGDLATGEALAAMLPGVNLPAGSMAARFPLDHLRPIDSIRIIYPAGACGGGTDMLLPMRFTPAKAVKTPMPALPAGQTATDRPVRLQAIIDLEGATRRIVYMGGPPALTAAAIEAVRGWTAEPARLNGAPVIAPVTFQVKFGPQ